MIPYNHDASIRGLSGFSAFPQEGSVYAVDLAGFSALTEHWFDQDARRGSERISDLVTSVFSRLATGLTQDGLKVGGFGGDALTLWSEPPPQSISERQFEAAVSEALSEVSDEIKFRTACAAGPVCVGSAYDGRNQIPLIWGPAVSEVYDKLSASPVFDGQIKTGSADSLMSGDKLASAAVSNRWTVIIRLADSRDANALDIQRVREAWNMSVAMAANHHAICENLYQDEKGLMIVVGFAPGGQAEDSTRHFRTAADEGLRSLGLKPRFASALGTIFRTDAKFDDTQLIVSLGSAINRAAKSLDSAPDESPASPEIEPRSHFAIQGRGRELAALSALFKAQPDNQSAKVLIEGDAGSGKSALLSTFLKSYRGAVAALSLGPQHAFAPYAALTQLYRSLHLTTPASEDWVGDLPQLVGALPNLVVIDDWHWCDQSSAEILRTLFATSNDTSFLLLARPGIGVARFDDEPTLKLDIGPVGAVASEQIMTQQLGRPPTPEEAILVSRLSGGIPFWIAELSRSLADRHLIDIDDRQPGQGIAKLFQERATRLSASAMSLWRLMSCWQAPLSLSQAQTLLTPFDTQVETEHFEEIAALGWCVASRQSVSQVWVPSHQILTEMGMSDIPESVASRIYRILARYMLRSRDDLARVAEFWQHSGDLTRAAVTYQQAAISAGRIGAHSVALELFNKAEDCLSDEQEMTPRRASMLKAHRAAALWGTGQVRNALRELQSMDEVSKQAPLGLSGRHRDSRAYAEFVRAEAAHFAGNVSSVMRGMREGVRLGTGGANAFEARARRVALFAMMLSLCRIPARGRTRKLIEEAQFLEDSRAETVLQVYSAMMHICRCEWDRSLPPIRRASQQAEETHDPLLRGIVIASEAAHAMLTGDANACATHYARLGQLGDLAGQRMYQSWGAYGEAEARLQLGEYQEARALAEKAQRLRQGIGDHQSACIVEGVLAQASAGMGDTQAAFYHGRRALIWGEKLPMSNFTSLEGLAAPAMVAAQLRLDAPGEEERLKPMLKRGRKILSRYALIFPFARPRLLYVDAMADLTKNPERSAKKFAKTMKRSTELGMANERRLAETGLLRLKERIK